MRYDKEWLVMPVALAVMLGILAADIINFGVGMMMVKAALMHFFR